jgi:putative oxidoreductase
MKKFLSNDYLTLALRLFLGIIFIYASLDKIDHPDQFARIIFNYHILPGYLVNLVALIMPVAEFIAGVCLITGVFYAGARNFLLILLAIFMVAIGVNVIRGVDLECGCFTVSTRAKSAGLQLLLRDLVYLLAGLALLISTSRRWMIDNFLFHRR